MPDFAAEKRYRELVRLAYLVLPAEGPGEVRLALARRIVDRSLPHRPVSGHSYAHARERVLRHAMRPGRRMRRRLLPWLRGMPQDVPENAALATLSPDERVAYVLRRVQGMRRYAVRDLLVSLDVESVPALLDRVESMPQLDVVTPGPVGARRARRSRLPLVAAIAVTCALVATLAVEEEEQMRKDVVRAVPVAAAPVAPPPVEERILWEGHLPGHGGKGRLACRTVTDAEGAVRHEGVLSAEGRLMEARDCGDGRTAVWWRAPNEHWYYLAAGHGVRLRGGREHAGLAYLKAGTAEHAPERTIGLG